MLENTGGGDWTGVDYSGKSGAHTAYAGLQDSDGKFFIDAGKDGLDLVIDTDGNVGVNTTDPLTNTFSMNMN